MMRVGVLGFGGGPSTVPLFRYESVQKLHWMDDDEFAELLALANALPGPIATKLAAYLGYRQLGTAGAVLAVIAHILPTCLATLGLYGVFTTAKDSEVVSGMLSAVIPVVAVMLGLMTYEFAAKARKGLGMAMGITASAGAFLLLDVIRVAPALVILLFLAYGSVHFKLMDKIRKARGAAAEGEQ